jgi:uncharacterized protein (DUF1330 family)
VSTYIVFTRTKTTDQKELEKYRAGIKATMKDRPIEVLVADGKHEVLEGDPIEGTVIVKFPNAKAAKEWINRARPTKTPPSTANSGRSITDSLSKVSANGEEIHA